MHYKAIVLFLFLISCTTMIKKMAGVNRKFSFNSRSEYYNYLTHKKKIPPKQILFLDSISYLKFGQEALMVENPVVFFGSFLNDSVSIKKSEFLKDNQACTGRIGGEIEKNLRIKNYTDSIVETKINLAKYNFYYLYSKQKFNMPDSKKQLKIFLLYYYPFGIAFDKVYKETEAAWKKNIEKTDLYIICVDPVYALKN